MNEPNPELLWQLVEFDYPIAISALAIMICGTVVLSTVVRKEIALGIMFIKVSIVVIYFCGFADGTWFYGGDDKGLFQRGLSLAETGRNPLTIWSHHQAVYLANSLNSLWGIYVHNYLAIFIMGPHYYAPIFLNVLITAITVTCLAKVIRPLSNDLSYLTYFVIFASLHWTTLAWSSFLNLKGPSVACLMAIALLAITNLSRHFLKNGLALLVCFYLMTKIRYYFPAFILGGLVVEKIFEYTGIFFRKKNLLLIVPLCGIAAWDFVPRQIGLFVNLANFSGFPYGFIHFILQPLPWRVTEPATYLILPSVLHLIMFIPMIIGGVMIWKKHSVGRLIIGVVLSGWIFYGLVDVVATTRHRIPFDMLIIVMHYHFIWELFIKRPSESGLRGHGVNRLKS